MFFSFHITSVLCVLAQSLRYRLKYWETITLHCNRQTVSLSRWDICPPLKECVSVELWWLMVLVVQWAAFGSPSGMSDMKKVMMNDHVDDRKPVWGPLFGSSAPSSPLSLSSSEPSSIIPSCWRWCCKKNATMWDAFHTTVVSTEHCLSDYIWLSAEIIPRLLSLITP